MKIKFAAITFPAAAAVALAFTLPSLFAQNQNILASAPASAAETTPAISADVPQTLVKLEQWRGEYGDQKARSEVFTTAQDWSKFWKHLGISPHNPLNEKTQMAVCIYIGKRPTSGYKPFIVSAAEHNGKMVVSYSTGQPAPDEVVTPDTTAPWVAAIIPKSALPLVFKEI